MTVAVARRSPATWLTLAAIAGFWFATIRLLSPQWSLYVQYHYGWAVPLLCVYLLWRRWRDRPAPSPARPRRGWLVAAACAWFILPTRLFAEANPIWRAASWAMALEVIGLTLALFYLAGGGAWLRHFWFPVAFFLVAVPWPSGIENALIQSLTRLNTAMVVEALTVVGIPAAQAGNVIEIGNARVGIDEACSGIRSLQSTLMMALFFGELYRLAVGRRIGVVGLGAALALLSNAIRTFVLVRVCAADGRGALEQWHDPTGVGILLVCFTSLWLVAERLRRRTPPPTPVAATAAAVPVFSPTGAFALGLWFIGVEAATAAWFGVGASAGTQSPQWSVRWPTDKPDQRDVPISVRAQAELKFDEGRSMGWREPDGSLWQVFYFRWGPAHSLTDRVRVQCARMHRPDICLPAAGRTLRRYFGMRDFPVGGAPMPFRVYEFEERGRPLYVYYGATEDGTRGWIANLRENTASRVAAALARSRCVSQRVLQIAVWGYPGTEQANAAVERLLREMVQAP